MNIIRKNYQTKKCEKKNLCILSRSIFPIFPTFSQEEKKATKNSFCLFWFNILFYFSVHKFKCYFYILKNFLFDFNSIFFNFGWYFYRNTFLFFWCWSVKMCNKLKILFLQQKKSCLIFREIKHSDFLFSYFY